MLINKNVRGEPHWSIREELTQACAGTVLK